jgi:GntR family transcriptional regulator
MDMRMSVQALRRDRLRPGPEPLYAQIARELKEPIVTNQVEPGTLLPGENDLAAYFQVSRDTIRHAVRELTNAGLVSVSRGFGIAVQERPIEAELSGLTGFAEDMDALGLVPSSRLIGIQTVVPDDRIREQLRLDASDDAVTEIRRVRLADGVPISYDITWLPKWIGDKIAGDDLESDPIFSLLEKKYGLALIEADYRITACDAESSVASALGIAAGSRILEIERTSYTAGGPIDYERLLYCADRLKFRMRLKRHGQSAPRNAAVR